MSAHPNAIEASMANTWQGDNLQTKQNKDTTRMMFHNIRHLSLTGVAGIEEFVHEQDGNQIDILAIKVRP